MSGMKHMIETMTDQAIETILWIEDLDNMYSAMDVTPDTVADLALEVTDFLGLVQDHKSILSEQAFELITNNPTQAAHDFILSRNGHGTGFWDRGNGDVGDFLHECAKSFGTISAYFTDDNTVDFT